MRRVAASDRLRNFQFEPARLHSEYPRCWVFVAASPEMLALDYAPAGMFAYIDKADGHAWNNKEIDLYFNPQNHPARLNQIEVLAA
jgi:hypothetical protein